MDLSTVSSLLRSKRKSVFSRFFVCIFSTIPSHLSHIFTIPSTQSCTQWTPNNYLWMEFRFKKKSKKHQGLDLHDTHLYEK